MAHDKISFNKQSYAVMVILVNKHGAIPISKNRIASLSITEDLNSIFPSGKISIDNTGNLIDQTPAITGRTEHLDFVPTYAFNTDNRDMIIVDIFPIVGDNDLEVFPHESNRLYYEFFIVDEDEDISDDGTKIKVCSLRDAREQALEESNIQWSSSEAVVENMKKLPGDKKRNINFSQVSNELRSPYTGDAIKSLIKKAVPVTNVFVDWDKGKTKFFCSTSPQCSTYDTLETLLDHHISATDNDNCILTADRTSQGQGHWSLRSLSELFRNVVDKDNLRFGKFTRDIFHVTSGGSSAPTKSRIPQKGFAEIASNEAVQRFTGLEKFKFLNMPNGLSMDGIVTTYTHGYNYSEKQFDIDCKNNHISKIRKRFSESYVDHMLGDPPIPIFPIDKERLENKVINHIYSSGKTVTDRIKDGTNRVLSRALAYTPGIEFAVPGSIHRQPGRFIILLDSTIEPGSSFEKILSGEWLMTTVSHYFNFSVLNYSQNVTCLKPHSYAKLAADTADDIAAEKMK